MRTEEAVKINLRPWRPAVAILLLWAATATAFPDAQRQFVMPVVDEGPALQGDLSSPVWQQAMQLQDFVAANHIATLPVPTEVFTICDSEFLYAGFVCHEPQIGQLRTFTSGHDGPVWTDDCVEVTLDVANGKVWLYHWIVNSHGLIWDGLHFPTGLDASFNAAAVAKCSVQSDRWICELKIPFQAVGGPPRPGEVWGINFCRERRVSDDVELTSWFPAQTGFSDPANTGEAVFAPPGDGVVLSVLSRGGACADVNEDGLNVFSVRADNTGAEYAKVRAEMRTDGHVVAAAEAVIAGGKAGTVAVGYQVPYPGQAVFQYLVHVDGKQVYESQLQACKPKFRGPRSWVVPDPMFEGLFSEEPAGLCREGVLIWGHLNDVSLLRETAKRFGVRYVEDEIYREHGVHGLHLIGHAIRQKDPEDPWTRWNVTNVPVAERQPADVPWILDPRSIEHHIEEYGKMLQMPHPLVWGFFAGDEMEDRAMAQGAGLMAKPGDYEYIKQADEEVKREFGGGKWGIPSGIIEQDPNPYKWIAYQRWINARMRDRHRRLRDLVRKYEPDMPIVSTDAGGIISPYEWSTQAEYFDIFTHQIGCRGSQWRAQPGCISKIVSDLTGKEFWPCVHVENYGMDTTPEEVVEELSQVFRNGGSGFHFFLSDIANSHKLIGDTKTPYFGSPRRWRTIMNIVDLIKTMPRPKYPEYNRTAILFNDDTLAATPYDAKRPYAEHTEACYTLLGPVARSWFKFIDCAQAINRPALADDFDIIYVPTARYQRTEVVAKLREFVAAGGTLVCGDPQAFETDLLGNDTVAARTELFGVTVGEKLAVEKLIPAGSEPTEELALKGDAYKLTPQPGVEVLASYEDGSPATTSHSFEKGKAIVFGCNPFWLAAVEDAAWRKFFEGWVKAMGAPTGLDIWRFRFPDSVIWKEPLRAGYCLTNNRVVWQEEKPRYLQDRDVGATYQYSPAPDAMPDAVTEEAIPCKEGHLTDRRQSIMARKVRPGRGAPYELPADRWMVGWETTEPVSVTFDLQETWVPLELKLWFCDTMPEVTVEGSRDGRQWQVLGKAAGEQAGEDVYDMAIALNKAVPCRYVRVNFAARQPEQKLSLVEVEVWGKETKG